MAIAIISRVNELTLILAVIVAVAHFAVIFWPRKPITGPTDKDGMPIVWLNQDDSRQDIACVWQESSAKGAAVTSEVQPTSIASFSENIKPLGAEAAESKRSVA